MGGLRRWFRHVAVVRRNSRGANSFSFSLSLSCLYVGEGERDTVSVALFQSWVGACGRKGRPDGFEGRLAGGIYGHCKRHETAWHRRSQRSLSTSSGLIVHLHGDGACVVRPNPPGCVARRVQVVAVVSPSRVGCAKWCRHLECVVPLSIEGGLRLFLEPF